MAISLLAYLATFSEQLFFFGEPTSTQQSLFRSIYFFRAAAFFKELSFRKSHLLAAVFFQNT